MPQLTTTLVDRQGMFGAGLNKRLTKLVAAERLAANAAAATATAETRKNVHHHRDITPPRHGRSSTGGKMGSHLTWRVTPDGVAFDTAAADAGAQHWIIQEIGTGSRATMRTGGQKNPQGRPAKGATYIRTVKAQTGRVLRGGLVFATAGGHYSPTGSAHGEAIYWASSVAGVPRGAPRIRITKEIAAQHFVRDGGRTGFRQYRTSVLAAARQAFSQAAKP